MQSARINPKFKNITRGIVCDSGGTPFEYYGSVVSKMDYCCFVSCAEIGENVYIHYSDFGDIDWDLVNLGIKITYQLSFNLRGPVGVHAHIGQ